MERDGCGNCCAHGASYCAQDIAGAGLARLGLHAKLNRPAGSTPNISSAGFLMLHSRHLLAGAVLLLSLGAAACYDDSQPSAPDAVTGTPGMAAARASEPTN